MTHHETDEAKQFKAKAFRKHERRRIDVWRSKNREKQRAIEMVGSAIREFNLTRGPCVKCGTDVRVCGFHDHGYTKPLDVVWRCRSCNSKIRNVHDSHKRRQWLYRSGTMARQVVTFNGSGMSGFE
jgi:hypothetical protein